MEVLILTVFISLLLVATELLFFAWNLHQGTHDHADRLSLLPLEEDAIARAPASSGERKS
jgi:cbb3-type cytochrome oxidase maturation protein